jgi:ATP-binding cassette, subfamily A (ABC1), member 3
MLVMYMTGYMQINSTSTPDEVPSQLLLLHWTLGLITPVGQLTRAFMVGLNLFSTVCTGLPPVKSIHPGTMDLYGGPIVYLIGQSLFLFGILIWSDRGFSLHRFRKPQPQDNPEDHVTNEPEVCEEINRVATTTDDGLRVLHISKSFRSIAYGKVTAVDDVTLGVKRGEVFALVGPNGGVSFPLFFLLMSSYIPF